MSDGGGCLEWCSWLAGSFPAVRMAAGPREQGCCPPECTSGPNHAPRRVRQSSQSCLDRLHQASLKSLISTGQILVLQTVERCSRHLRLPNNSVQFGWKCPYPNCTGFLLPNHGGTGGGQFVIRIVTSSTAPIGPLSTRGGGEACRRDSESQRVPDHVHTPPPFVIR
jgi:hypothetical protein